MIKNPNMKKFIDNFDCYVINLPDNTRRKELFLKEWKNKAEIKFIDAVDTRKEKWLNYKQHLSPQALKDLNESLKNKKRKTHEMLSPGAIGCFLSHLKCWQEFEKNEKKYALIFEDDTSIPDKFFVEVKRIMNMINTEWDMINLGSLTRKASNFNNELHRVYSFFCTHSYIIDKKSVKKLLSGCKKITMQIDGCISQMTEDFIIIAPKKQFCTQKNSCGISNVQTIMI